MGSLKITSTKNPRIKLLLNLQKPSERKETGLMIIEGIKEISMAIESGVFIQSLFFCPELFSDFSTLKTTMQLAGNKYELIEISREVFAKVAYRENSTGILATAKIPAQNIEQLKLSENPLVLILDKVEKPGNVGAILRTADAAGIDAVLICDGPSDLYNPNIIRASLGCVFSCQAITCISEDALHWLKKKRIKPFVTNLAASISYDECNLSGATAIVLGSEDKGVSEFWQKNSFRNILIPMYGKVDSMNVSVSAAIIVFEALRQRKNK